VTLAGRTRPLVLDGPELSRLPRVRKGSVLLDLLPPGARVRNVSRVPLQRLWITWSMMTRLVVAAANNIVAELARTNALLEKSIEAAKGSRAATERMCSRLELFLQQQREFQALLFKELRLDTQITSDKAWMGPDEEEEGDEEMENASRSEEGRSGGDEGSMEM